MARLEGAARGVSRRLPRRTTSGTPSPTARRCAVPIRPSSSSPGVGHAELRCDEADRPGRRRVLPERDQRHARRRGGLDATPRSPSRRSSGSSTGRSRRPSSPGCRRRSRSPAGSRSSPARARGSAGRSRIRLAAEGACVVVADIDEASARSRRGRDRRPGRGDRARRRRDRRGDGRRRVPGRDARVRRRRPGRQQRRPVDLEAAARDDRRTTGTSSTT